LRPISRFLHGIFDYGYLVRLPTSFGGAAFVFWLAKHNGLVDLRTSVYAAGATFCAIAAGFSLNDATDAREDQVNNPYRPVARGSISVGSAIFAYAALAILGLLFGMLTKSSTRFSIALLMLVAVSFYSLFIRRVWFLKNVFVSGTVATLPLMASSCSQATRTSLLLIVTLFVWSLEKEILIDVRDVEGDRLVGLKTLPTLLGSKQIGLLVAAINLTFWALVLSSSIARTLFLGSGWQLCLATAHTAFVTYLTAKGRRRWMKLYLRMQETFVVTVLLLILL